MSRAPNLCVVVCNNGLGHFRRVLDVASCLADLEPDLSVAIVCEEWQRRRFDATQPLVGLMPRFELRWIHGVMARSVHYANEPSGYADGGLTDWAARLSEVDEFREARVVVSDNLAGVLDTRPDATLMGCFLWSDVLAAAFPNDPSVAAFVAWERELLAAHRPTMLCVGDIAMPGVFERTRAIPLAWMRAGKRSVAPVPRLEPEPAMISVLVGATQIRDEVALALAGELLQTGCRVALPERLCSRSDAPSSCSPFHFRTEDFLRTDVAVCRPGLGAIHDCLFYALPMVLMLEENPELLHNARRLEALGLGVCSELHESPRRIAQRTAQLASSREAAAIRSKMATISFNGAHQAALHLHQQLRQAC